MPIAATPTSNWPLFTAGRIAEKSWPVKTTLWIPTRLATSLKSSTSKPVKFPEASVKVYGLASPMLATRAVPASIRWYGLSLPELASDPEELEPHAAVARIATAAAAAAVSRRAMVFLFIAVSNSWENSSDGVVGGGEAGGPERVQQRVRAALCELLGDQLAGDEAERCAAVREGDVVALDAVDHAEHGFAVTRDGLGADAVGLAGQRGTAFEHREGLLEQALDRLLVHLVGAVRADIDLLLRPGRVEDECAVGGGPYGDAWRVEHRAQSGADGRCAHQQRDRCGVRDGEAQVAEGAGHVGPGGKNRGVERDDLTVAGTHPRDTPTGHGDLAPPAVGADDASQREELVNELVDQTLQVHPPLLRVEDGTLGRDGSGVDARRQGGDLLSGDPLRCVPNLAHVLERVAVSVCLAVGAPS